MKRVYRKLYVRIFVFFIVLCGLIWVEFSEAQFYFEPVVMEMKWPLRGYYSANTAIPASQSYLDDSYVHATMYDRLYNITRLGVGPVGAHQYAHNVLSQMYFAGGGGIWDDTSALFSSVPQVFRTGVHEFPDYIHDTTTQLQPAASMLHFDYGWLGSSAYYF